MVYIYLGKKSGTYKTYVTKIVYADVTVSNKIWEKCNKYEVITYSIKYKGSYDNEYLTYFWNIYSYYNLYLYNGNDDKSKNIYNYYRPTKNDDIVKRIDAYFSVLDPSTPLAIIFTTRGLSPNMYYYSYRGLVSEGYKYYHLKGRIVTDGGDFGYVVEGKNLYENLQKEWKELSKGKTLTFSVDKGSTENICDKEYDVGNDKKFKKRIYTPDVSKKEQYQLFFEDLFKKSIGDHTLDYSYLPKVTGRKYDGIIVYYSVNDSIPLLVEFIGDSSKTQIKRLDREGKCWKKENVNYNDDNVLLQRLDELQSGLRSDGCNQLVVRGDNNGGGNGRRNQVSLGDAHSNTHENGISQPSVHEVPSLPSGESSREHDEPSAQSDGHESLTRDQETPSNTNTDWAAISGGTVGAVGLGGTGFAIYRFNNTILTFIKGLF